MLAVVKRPRIEIRAKHIPAPLVRFLKDTYKPENVIVSDEDVAVPFEESEWFKSLETTPAEMIVANRDLRNWSQVTLAEKLGIQVQNLCAMENGRRTVSRKMALKLGKIFGTDPAAFFDFGKLNGFASNNLTARAERNGLERTDERDFRKRCKKALG